MTKTELDFWRRNTSKEVRDWFNAQPPKLKQTLEYNANDVDVTASAIDEVRKTWTTNMSDIEYDIQNALHSYGRVSNIEMETCLDDVTTTMRVEFDVTCGLFSFDMIREALSKIPWIHRVVNCNYNANTKHLMTTIELNRFMHAERRKNMESNGNINFDIQNIKEALARFGYVTDCEVTMPGLGHAPTMLIKLDLTGAYFDNKFHPIPFLTGPLSNPKPKKVMFNGPATIVYWSDNTKTIVKCMEGEKFDPEKGLAMAICKRLYGGNFHRVFKDSLKNAETRKGNETKLARAARVAKAKKKEG